MESEKRNSQADDASPAAAGRKERMFKGIPIDRDLAAEAFYELAEGYFGEDRSFGTFPKSEIDSIMFAAFDKAAGGERAKSDLDIALLLQTTPSRVQSQRMKIALRSDFPRDSGVILVSALSKGAFAFKPGRSNRESRIKLRLESKVQKMAFVDDLQKKGVFYDLSFSNLVVEMSMAGALMVLINHAFSDADKEKANKILKKGTSSRRRFIQKASKGKRFSTSEEEACDLLLKLYNDAIYDSAEEALMERALSSVSSFLVNNPLAAVADAVGLAGTLADYMKGDAIGAVSEAFKRFSERVFQA